MGSLDDQKKLILPFLQVRLRNAVAYSTSDVLVTQ